MTRPKDRPQEDPHVKELGGFDVTNLSVDALRKAGVAVGQLVEVSVGENRAWKTHSEFLADDLPRWDVMDRTYARAAAAGHVRCGRRLIAEHEREGESDAAAAIRARPLAGLRLARSFPCLGMLRVVSERRRMVIVECDGCGETFGVSTPPDPRGEDEKPRRRERPIGTPEFAAGF